MRDSHMQPDKKDGKALVRVRASMAHLFFVCIARHMQKRLLQEYAPLADKLASAYVLVTALEMLPKRGVAFHVSHTVAVRKNASCDYKKMLHRAAARYDCAMQ